MKKYKVSYVWTTNMKEVKYIVVSANTPQNAINIAIEWLEKYGYNGGKPIADSVCEYENN